MNGVIASVEKIQNFCSKQKSKIKLNFFTFVLKKKQVCLIFFAKYITIVCSWFLMISSLFILDSPVGSVRGSRDDRSLHPRRYASRHGEGDLGARLRMEHNSRHTTTETRWCPQDATSIMARTIITEKAGNHLWLRHRHGQL